MVVHEISSRSEYEAAVRSHRKVVVDAYTTWCKPCKTASQCIGNLSKYHKNVYFIKVDIDAVPEVVDFIGVRAVPITAYYLDGKKVQQVMGFDPYNLNDEVLKLAETSLLHL